MTLKEYNDNKPDDVENKDDIDNLATYKYGQTKVINNDKQYDYVYPITGGIRIDCGNADVDYYTNTVWRLEGYSCWLYNDSSITDSVTLYRRGSQFKLTLTDEKKLYLYLSPTGNAYLDFTLDDALPDDEWVHIALVAELNDQATVGWKTDDGEHSGTLDIDISPGFDENKCLYMDLGDYAAHTLVFSPRSTNLFAMYDIHKLPEDSRPDGWFDGSGYCRDSYDVKAPTVHSAGRTKTDYCREHQKLSDQ